MKHAQRLGNVFVAFAAYSALVVLSLYLQEPVSMAGSAAVVVLGGGGIWGFLHVVVGRVSPIFCFLGALFAGLWFPLIFTLIGASYEREISGWQLTLAFFSCLRASEVATPTVSFVGAAGCGILLGVVVRRTIVREPAD